MQKRPFSRTATAVHQAILEDMVYPTEIVGKRIRIRQDQTKLHKMYTLTVIGKSPPNLPVASLTPRTKLTKNTSLKHSLLFSKGLQAKLLYLNSLTLNKSHPKWVEPHSPFLCLLWMF